MSNKKKQKTKDNPSFIKDGMETDEIRDIVQEIMLNIEENRNKMSHEAIISNLKNNINNIDFFEKRYPMLYKMVVQEEGFEYQNLEYFLKMRENIVQNKMTSEDASIKVGQEWFDKFYKK
jgi:hypothetical protein